MIFRHAPAAFAKVAKVAQAAPLALLAALAATPLARAEILPHPELGATAAEMVRKLETHHYARRAFGDELSSTLLDTYLDNLDPSRSLFLQSDIAAFEPLRFQLDDQLRGGNVEAGFAIFNRYHQRLRARFDKLLAGLDAQVAGFDFTRREYLSLEPETLGWPIDEAEADERWRKRVKNEALSLKLAGKPADEILPTLRKRFESQSKRIDQYNVQDVFQIYANALTRLYDPHTTYFSPRTSENFNINMSLSLEGIGAVLQREDEHTKVVRLVPAGPADKQGELQPSDRILGVAQGAGGGADSSDFVDVVGWRLDEVVQLIRGPKGTTVRLEVQPAKASSPDARKVITIVRNKVKLEEQSAQKDILEIPRGDRTLRLGVIDIPAFYADFEGQRRGDPDYKSTTRDVRRLLEELVAEGVDGIIIDLRNNGGGSLQEANELTGLFIEQGPTVQIRHTSNRVFFQGKREASPYYRGPLAVLINRLSASASEIFAGAIQDYQRGIVVGSQSYGKGTVQRLLDLPEGQIKLTESKFYRISGGSTQHLGVVPDVAFPPRYDREVVGESTLDHALEWDQIEPVNHRKYFDIPALLPYLSGTHAARVGADPDFIYLRDSFDLAGSQDDITWLSLNEAERIALREEREAGLLAAENRRRLAKGLEPVDDLDALDEDSGGDDELADGAEDSVADDLADVAGDSAEGAAGEGALATATDAATGADAMADMDSAAAEDEEDEKEPDVLLLETGMLLVDALTATSENLAKAPARPEGAAPPATTVP